jgi:hypothetical protein
VFHFAVPFTSLSKLCKIAGPKPFGRVEPACFDFPSSNFLLQRHILSTSGAALSPMQNPQLYQIVPISHPNYAIANKHIMRVTNG